MVWLETSPSQANHFFPSKLILNVALLQAVSNGEISAAEGAVKLISYLQETASDTNLPQSAALQLLNSQPGPDFTPSPSAPAMAQLPSDAQQLRLEVVRPDEQPPIGAVELLDIEVPAPRKRLPGEEKLRSWLTEGVQVPAPPKAGQAGFANGFLRPETHGTCLRPCNSERDCDFDWECEADWEWEKLLVWTQWWMNASLRHWAYLQR